MRRVRESRDGLTNLMSGAGTAADKRAHGIYALRHADPAQIEAAYRSSWLMRKVVNLPQVETRVAALAGGAGRDRGARGGEAAAEPASQAAPHPRAGAAVRRRCPFLLGVRTDDPATPLDPARVGKGALRYAHVLSRRELGHGAKRLDPEDPLFGQPEYFTLRAAGAGWAEVRLGPRVRVAR